MCLHLPVDVDWDKPVCKAFPKGIPEDILSNEFNHRTTEHPDQSNKVLYKEIEDGLIPIDWRD